jgi:hypothetical protein
MRAHGPVIPWDDRLLLPDDPGTLPEADAPLSGDDEGENEQTMTD